MDHWKTTAVGVFKFVAACIFVGVKVVNHQELTTADWAIASALGGGFLGNLLSADAPKKDAP